MITTTASHHDCRQLSADEPVSFACCSLSRKLAYASTAQPQQVDDDDDNNPGGWIPPPPPSLPLSGGLSTFSCIGGDDDDDDICSCHLSTAAAVDKISLSKQVNYPFASCHESSSSSLLPPLSQRVKVEASESFSASSTLTKEEETVHQILMLMLLLLLAFLSSAIARVK